MLKDPVKTKDQIVEWIRGYFAENGPTCSAVVGISGGKDSSVTAALLKEALGKERVVGVLMPNGVQSDIADSEEIVKLLDIPHVTVNIRAGFEGLFGAVNDVLKDGGIPGVTKLSRDSEINMPPRLRMSTLYAIGQALPNGGRVANTCNRSEDYIGYSTKFGDAAGDFSPLSNLLVHEVIQIGEILGLPERLTRKAPSDGLSGMTDEDKIGFTYAVLDHYVLTGECEDEETRKKIDRMHRLNLHKLRLMPAYKPDDMKERTLEMKERSVGTVSRGIRCPIIREGDDLSVIVTDSVLKAAENEGFALNDRDVIAVTESIVARAQGNYASVDDIAADVREKLGGETIGVIFPILSRNRFAICLRGIAKGAKKVVLMLSYPSDEVGNALLTMDQIDDSGVNPYSDVLSLEKYRELFGYGVHEFTGVDYISYYEQLIRDCGAEPVIIFANQAKAILNYADCILNCDIHTRKRTKRILLEAGAKKVVSLDEILNAPVNGSGYNEKYGLLGSNKSTEDKIKLFPRASQPLVEGIQKNILEKTGRKVEVMVYGDGAFKDPQGKIWELADPVVSPFFTDGLIGTPNELKLKYLADNDFKDLSGEELKKAISESIRKKDKDLKGTMATQGTTPRQLTDLIGSLCDLTSGSGDKGTPVVLVQGYFDNYTN